MGHNKWSRSKTRRAPWGLQDAERSWLFQKLAMLLHFVVKERGPNPDLNTSLANISKWCRSKSMPKASIEAAIKGGGLRAKQLIGAASLGGGRSGGVLGEEAEQRLEKLSKEELQV
ncbi:unnamed protein product [Natator depressus]